MYYTIIYYTPIYTIVLGELWFSVNKGEIPCEKIFKV